VNVDAFKNIRNTAINRGGFYRDLSNNFVSYVPGNRILIVSFDNAYSPSILENRSPYGFNFIARRGWSSLGVMEKKKNWFRQEDLRDLFDELKATGFFFQFDKIVFYGASMGSFGATVYSSAAPNSTVLIYGPRATHNHKYFKENGFIEHGDNRYDCVPTGVSNAGEVFLFYDPLNAKDAKHADIFRNLNTELIECRHLGHVVANEFASMSILKPILEKVVDESLNRTEFYKLFRQRKSSTSYIHKLMMVAISNGHYFMALKIVMKMTHELESGPERWKFRRHRKGLRQAINRGGTYNP